jgi:hypothetical protein
MPSDRSTHDYNWFLQRNHHQTSFFSSVVERGIAANARHPKVPVSITGGSCSFAVSYEDTRPLFDPLQHILHVFLREKHSLRILNCH